MMIAADNVFGFFELIFNFLTLKLGLCALCSVPVFCLILVFRKVFDRKVFLKVALWSLLLVTPFLGRLKFFFRRSALARPFQWWIVRCTGNFWVSRVYFAGLVATFLLLFGRRWRLNGFVRKLPEQELFGVRVRVCPHSVTPFTTGVFCPQIVVPRLMLNACDEAEIRTVLLHERIHIRLFHLAFYLVWDLLRVLLWANPLFAFCLKYFREDLEDICDRVTIQRGKCTGYAYGSLLLKSLKLLKDNELPRNLKTPVAFAGDEPFLQIKKRMKRVVDAKGYRKRAVYFAAGFAVCSVGALSLFALGQSYSRYQECDDLSVYDASGARRVLEDSEALRALIRLEEDCLVIDGEGLLALLREAGAKEELYVISVGGFMKMPGYGGGWRAVIVPAVELAQGSVRVPYDGKGDFWEWLYKRI